jgi:hypothetical protein
LLLTVVKRVVCKIYFLYFHTSLGSQFRVLIAYRKHFLIVCNSWVDVSICVKDMATHVIPELMPSIMNTCATAPPTDFPQNYDLRRPELWYWEAARQLQLLAAVALVVFTPALMLSARAALLLLLYTVITFSHVVLAPFKDAWVNTLEFSVLATTLFNISGALLISGGAAGGDGSWRSLLLGLAVLAINAALVTCIIYSVFRNQLKHVRSLLSSKRISL